MSSITINALLLDAVSALTTGASLDVNGSARDLAFFIFGSAAVTGGRVQIEEAHDPAYVGTWERLGPPIDVLPSGVLVFRPWTGAYKAIRARVETAVTGGGVVTVRLIGVSEP